MELLSAEDVAELMGVKESTVWRWCREGHLPCLKVGKHWRVRRGGLEELLSGSRVWWWVREGLLPCLKVGKHWRVRRGDLEDFLKRSQHQVTLAGQLDSFLQEPDSVLAIAQNLDILHRLDAAFFRVGEARGGLLVKFYAGEEYSESELLARFEQNGLEA